MEPERTDSKNRARLKLVLIGLACALPFAAAWVAYLTGWTPGGAANYGDLLAPRVQAEAPFDEMRGKWLLVSFDTGACDSYCERKLYLMRQIRRAQGKEQNRLERLWVLTDAAPVRPELQSMIDGTRIVALPASGLADFVAAGERADHIYLVDPLGNLMLRYPREPDPSRMIKDLKRLLKYSGFG